MRSAQDPTCVRQRSPRSPRHSACQCASCSRRADMTTATESGKAKSKRRTRGVFERPKGSASGGSATSTRRAGRHREKVGPKEAGDQGLPEAQERDSGAPILPGAHPPPGLALLSRDRRLPGTQQGQAALVRSLRALRPDVEGRASEDRRWRRFYPATSSDTSPSARSRGRTRRRSTESWRSSVGSSTSPSRTRRRHQPGTAQGRSSGRTTSACAS